MGVVDKALWYIFALTLVLMLLVYYVGVKSDAGAVGDTITSIVRAVTGNNNGKYSYAS